MEKKLEVNNLTVSFRTNNGKVQAVRGINFELNKGETLAIVGESGSGKSVTSKSILGILAGNSIIEGGEIIYDGPLAVMINRFSASSSEIFAAAIRDYGRGIITGDRKTHGKGTVQIVSDLDRYMPYLTGRRFKAGAIRLTNAKFYRINGASTQIQGISSDIPFPSVTDLMDIGEDKLDHPLAWDTIPATNYSLYTGKYKLDDARRKILKERSEKRRATDPDYLLMKKNLAEYAKIKDRKTIKLNFTARWEEYLKQKKVRDEEEKVLKALSSKRHNKDQTDTYLNETMNILLDLIQLPDQPAKS